MAMLSHIGIGNSLFLAVRDTDGVTVFLNGLSARESFSNFRYGLKLET